MRANTSRIPAVDQSFAAFSRSGAAVQPRDSTPPPMPYVTPPRPTTNTGLSNTGKKVANADGRRASVPVNVVHSSSHEDAAEVRKAEIERRLRELREQRGAAVGTSTSSADVPTQQQPSLQRQFFDNSTKAVGFDLSIRKWKLLQQSGSEDVFDVSVGGSVVVTEKEKDIADMERSFMAFYGALQRARGPFAESVARSLYPFLKSDPIRSVYTGEIATITEFYTNLTVEEYAAELPICVLLKFADGAVKFFSTSILTPQGAPPPQGKAGQKVGAATIQQSSETQSRSPAETSESAPLDSIMAIVESRMKALEARNKGAAAEKASLANAAEEDVSCSLQAGVAGLAGLSSFQKKSASGAPKKSFTNRSIAPQPVLAKTSSTEADTNLPTSDAKVSEEKDNVHRAEPNGSSPPQSAQEINSHLKLLQDQPTITPRRTVRQEGSTGSTPQVNATTFKITSNSPQQAQQTETDNHSPLPPIPPHRLESSRHIIDETTATSPMPFHRANSSTSIAVATAIAPLTVTAMPKRRWVSQSASPTATSPPKVKDEGSDEINDAPSPDVSTKNKTFDKHLQAVANELVFSSEEKSTALNSSAPIQREASLWLRADSSQPTSGGVSSCQPDHSDKTILGEITQDAATKPLVPINVPPLSKEDSALWLDANGSPLELAGSRVTGIDNSSSNTNNSTTKSLPAGFMSNDTLSPKALNSTATSAAPQSPYTATVAWGNEVAAIDKTSKQQVENDRAMATQTVVDDADTSRFGSTSGLRATRTITSVINDVLLQQHQQGADEELAPPSQRGTESTTPKNQTVCPSSQPDSPPDLQVENGIQTELIRGDAPHQEPAQEVPEPIIVKNEPSIIPLTGRGPIVASSHGSRGAVPTVTKYVAKYTRSMHVSAIPVGAPKGQIYVSKFRL